MDDLPSKEIQLELLRNQFNAARNTAFVHRSQARAFKDAGLDDQAVAAAKEQDTWERVMSSYREQIKAIE